MLRISFATPRPFFPYREFESRKGVAGREFSLFVIATTKMIGSYESIKPWKTYHDHSASLFRRPLKATKVNGNYEFGPVGL
ncbi:MAG: hypothetical protein V4760_17910, partial [Bdellovibrionota bacterium]